MALTDGDHPYIQANNYFDVQNNISNHNLQTTMRDSRLGAVGARDLIMRCLHPIAKSRPRVSQIKFHGLFWTPDRWVAFMTNFSNSMTTQKLKSSSIFGNQRFMWKRKTENKLGVDAFAGNRYDEGDVYSCIRFLRNIHEHRGQNMLKSDRVLEQLGHTELSFFGFVFDLLPELFGMLFQAAPRVPQLSASLADSLKFYNTAHYGGSGSSGHRGGGQRRRGR
jgi:hypothetical protein